MAFQINEYHYCDTCSLRAAIIKVGICFTKRYLSWLTRLPETQLRELREENRKKY